VRWLSASAVDNNIVVYRFRSMTDFFWLKAAAKALVLPPTGPLLVAVAGLALCSRVPRVGRSLATAGVVGLLALSMPAVADFLGRLVDTSAPFELETARNAQAIVILGGGVRRDAPEYGGDTLATLTLERVRFGARVARLTGLPVLVSGGSVLGGEPEASLMSASLEREFGVPVRWIEAKSRTTHENAVLSARTLRQEGIDRIVLVTHALDTRRATAEFRAQGLAVVSAATGRRGDSNYTALDYLPGMHGLQRSYHATYEILANLVRVVALNR
jgi:uncharacterized SAM-binding protein YcdF (DUF218 family)